MFFFLQLVILLHRIFTLTTHPLFMGFMLIIIRIIYGLISYLLISTPWISYILIIVFIRGAIIMFIYMARLSSNENIKIRLAQTLILVTISEIVIIYMTNKKKAAQPIFRETNNLQTRESTIVIYKTYNEITIDITVVIIIYLLLVLIVAIKIISFNKRPLRT